MNQLEPYSENFKALPRQEYPICLLLNGSLYLSSAESLISNKSFSSNTIGYIMEPNTYRY